MLSAYTPALLGRTASGMTQVLTFCWSRLSTLRKKEALFEIAPLSEPLN